MYPKKKRCIFFVVSRLIQWLQYVSLLGLLGFSFITGIFFFLFHWIPRNRNRRGRAGFKNCNSFWCANYNKKSFTTLLSKIIHECSVVTSRRFPKDSNQWQVFSLTNVHAWTIRLNCKLGKGMGWELKLRYVSLIRVLIAYVFLSARPSSCIEWLLQL